MATAKTVSKKRKFVADGVFRAELNEFFVRELVSSKKKKKKKNFFFFFLFLLVQAEDGYAGVNVRPTPTRTEITIRATRTKNVLGEKGQRIRELTGLVAKRWGFAPGTLDLYAERVQNRGLSAVAQAESLKYKLIGGLAVRRACYGVMRFVMEAGAKGVELRISGKLRGQRAKGQIFRDGYMIKSGQSARDFVDKATRSCLLRQGVIGLKVSIMLPIEQPKPNAFPMADLVTILDPKVPENNEPAVV
jgi:small subunit ribosomal protein S3e